MDCNPVLDEARHHSQVSVFRGRWRAASGHIIRSTLEKKFHHAVGQSLNAVFGVVLQESDVFLERITPGFQLLVILGLYGTGSEEYGARRNLIEE